eukprot:GEMP01002690.1.p1 GENE.GEMP01002690.1~~GEMP01002690.1.p1  ORF type:complete len:1168 (+),score=251.11 GEMP01002690.1:56-3559(+)
MVGLTSEVAYLRLVNDVRKVLDTEKHVSRRPLSFNEKVDFGVGASVLTALVVAASYYKDIRILAEFLVLFPALLLLAYTTYLQRCHSSIFAQEKVKEVLERFEEADEHREEPVQVQGVPLAATSTMVPILRDGKWSAFPANIIAEGDLFRLHPGASIPVESKGVRISGYECVPTGDEFGAGEMWDPADDRPGHFLAKHTVAALQVKKFLRLNLDGENTHSGCTPSLGTKPPPSLSVPAEADTVFAELAQIVRYRLLLLFVVAVVMASIACGVWASQLDFQDDPYLESESWLVVFRIASCFAFIMPRLLFLFTDAWGTARVSALVEWHAGTVQGPAKGGNPDPSRVPWRTIVHELVDSFSQVGCGRNLLHTLNSVTVLAFCDKEGLVTDTCRSVRELAIMQPPEPLTQQQEKNSSDRVLTPIVLDIHVDPRQQSGFRFEEASWAHYISSLKPLALAMAVSHQPLHHNKDLTQQKLQISDAMKMLAGGLEVLQDCLCGAARLIGLRDSVAKSFKIIRLYVHVSRTAQQKGEKVCFAKGMMQWLLRDARDQSVQMFCKAPGHEVIDRCSHYFAGNQIYVLTKKDKKVLANLMLQWGSTGSFAVGYSYRPVVDYDKFKDFLETGTMQRGGSSSNEELIMNEHTMNSDSVMSRFFRDYNNNHILLGLAALKISASVVVPRYLTKVQEAGIRFCLFSPLGDKKTRTTGALLGLETGWNCLIALEPKPEEKVRKNLMGQVVLPSGIPEIRNHLETVDNVPLLVSLFSRASPHTTREMIKILQENGECVVLLGSALKPENFELFYEADSSVSILVGAAPLCDHCAGLLEPLETDRPGDTYVPREIQLSADLTSLPCALQASHSFHDGEQRTICVLVHAIKEARRSVDSIFLVLVFFSCSIMIIALMLVLKVLLSLPSLLTGVHLALIATIELPLLSLCLLWNRAHDGIMKEFPFKKADEKMHAQPDRMIALYSIRSLPTAVVIVALFLIYLDQCWDSALQEFTEAHGQVSACTGFAVSWWFTGQWVACWLGWQNLISSLPDADTLEDGPTAVLPSVQIAIGWLVTVYMIIFSAGFLNRCESIFVVGISSNRLWLFTSVLIFCIHSTIAAIQMYGVHMTYRPPVPTSLWFAISGSWCVVVVGLNEWVKYKDRLFHLKSQKHLQVLFSTRLGMWSPK